MVPGAVPHEGRVPRPANTARPPTSPIPASPSMSGHHLLLVIALWLVGPRSKRTSHQPKEGSAGFRPPSFLQWGCRGRRQRGCLFPFQPGTLGRCPEGGVVGISGSPGTECVLAAETVRQTEWPKPQKGIISQFWRLEVQDQGVAGLVPPDTPLLGL